jgi:hypothetical protein
MPVVMVLGGDPLAFFYGGVEAPYGVFELDIVGGMRGRATKMVRGKVTGLPFPANAEIVLEGYVAPDNRGTKVRSANGAAIMPAAGGRFPCLMSTRSITATIRSWSVCRRWAADLTRWRAIAP